MQEENSSSSYRSIFKATSFFGGVQVILIIVNIVKSKIIAVLLGPAGIGLLGIYQSSIGLIQNLSSMGLSQSAVRDVAEANGQSDDNKIRRTVSVLRGLVWITGSIGVLLFVLSSPLLSNFSFGSYGKWLYFVLLSPILLFDQLSKGQKVVLQGLRRLKDLAKTTLLGAIFGLLISIPLYIILGIDGIIPMLVITSIAGLFVSWFYSRKANIHTVSIGIMQMINEGKSMMRLGFAMSITTVLASTSNYVLLSFLQRMGGVEIVGYYQAGSMIINSYAGMMFTAMATDFFPRLSAVNKDNCICTKIINRQIEIGLLILGPMLLIAFLFMPYFVVILYSDSFLPVCSFIIFSTIGILFKLCSWAISYVLIAKEDSSTFLWSEGVSCAYMLLFNIVGYLVGGLTGMGISFAFSYIIYLVQVFIIANRKYEYIMSQQVLRLLFICLLLSIICILIIMSFNGGIKYYMGLLVLSISLVYSGKKIMFKIRNDD